MESSVRVGHDVSPMASTNAQSQALWIPAALVVTGAAIAATYAFARDTLGAADGLGSAIVAFSMLVSALSIFGRLRRPGAWHSTRWIGIAVLGLTGAFAVFLLRELTSPAVERDVVDAIFLLACALFLGPLWIELHDHLEAIERRELVADVGLITVAVGAIIYLALRPSDAGTAELIWSAATALIVAASLATPPPPEEKVHGLTYGSIHHDAAKEIKASWDFGNKLMVFLILAGVLGMYVYFTVWLN